MTPVAPTINRRRKTPVIVDCSARKLREVDTLPLPHLTESGWITTSDIAANCVFQCFML